MALVDWDALEAEDRCECGVLLSEHPPLDPPKPWGSRKQSTHVTNTSGQRPYTFIATHARRGAALKAKDDEVRAGRERRRQLRKSA